MTCIEFFDKTAAENICACLTAAPDRVILLGGDRKVAEKHKNNYQKIFENRGKHIEFRCQPLPKNNLNQAVEVLSRLVETYDDCSFDVTGGDEMLLLALGVVYARYPDRVQIHKFNIRNNAVYDCDMDGTTIYREPPMLTVEENIRVYGGEVLYGDETEEKSCRWNLTEDFRADVNRLWSLCRAEGRRWNVFCNTLEAAEEVGTVSTDGCTTTADIGAMQHELDKDFCKLDLNQSLLRKLQQAGLVVRYSAANDVFSVTYKNIQVKKCLIKAGQALEMKVFCTARDLQESDGTPVYNDVRNGVVIDWDGGVDEAYDTENEIDVMMMHDVVPVFVSCKNGRVEMEELYKLDTVAKRFGGDYAKKVLVASSLDKGEFGKSFVRRATDMGIQVLDDVITMPDNKLQKELRNAWRG